MAPCLHTGPVFEVFREYVDCRIEWEKDCRAQSARLSWGHAHFEGF